MHTHSNAHGAIQPSVAMQLTIFHTFIHTHYTYTRMHPPVCPPPPSPPPLSVFSCSPSDTLSIIYIPTTCQTRKWQALLAPQDRPTQGHRVCEDTKKTHKPSDVESSARGTGDSADGRTSSMTAGSWGGETELNCQKQDALPHTRSVLEREQLWMREQLSYPSSTNPRSPSWGRWGILSKAKGGLEVTAQLSGIKNMFRKQLKALLCPYLLVNVLTEHCILGQTAKKSQSNIGSYSLFKI